MRLKLTLVMMILFICGAAYFLLHPRERLPVISLPVIEAKPFVIIIPSYNNESFVERNLFSVFSQKYENYRVIYIDDHSSDSTLAKTKECLKAFDKDQLTTVIKNSATLGPLASLYNTVHSCLDHEIIIILDGADALCHEYVLETLNKAYADPDIWLTYGTALNYPSFDCHKRKAKALSPKIIKHNLLRKSPLCTTPLYSFYSTLFKEIKIEDLFYRGRFYAMGFEEAITLPMLEMAKTHYNCIDDPLYLCNMKNPQREEIIHPSFQMNCIKHIRSRLPYSPIKQLPLHRQIAKEGADLVIFSKDNPLGIYALLESVSRYVMGVNKIALLYETTDTSFETGYLDLKLTFPKVQFIKTDGDFKKKCQKIAFASSLTDSEYIIFANDGVIIKDMIDLHSSISTLQATGAYGLYMDHHESLSFSNQLNRYQPIPIHTPLSGVTLNEIPYAWQFSNGSDDWNNPANISFALFRKENLKSLFSKLEYETPQTLLYEWGLQAPADSVGIFYSKAKSLCLELQEDQNLCLEKFLDGLKIDINPLFQIHSTSQEISTQMSYISR